MKNTESTHKDSRQLVTLVMGTRPEIIKMAPVALALAKHPQVRVEILHTGQHQEMAWPLYIFFGLQPAHTLHIERTELGLTGLSNQLLQTTGEVFARSRPAAVLVHGDTSSAAMGALAAAFSGVAVGHVEAGLRSGRLDEPFPEEINRSLIARVARWHFAPTELARDNLLREHVPGDISVVGNTVVDAVQHAAARLRQQSSGGAAVQWWRSAGLVRLVVVTAHRRENWGAPMQRILAAVQQMLAQHPDVGVVWPVHLNPQVHDAVQACHARAPAEIRRRWHVCPPLDYPEMVELMDASALLLTDSGGIQEEAVSLRKPILVLREVTERPEVISCGMGKLVGTAVDRIVAACATTLAHGLPSVQVGANPFGDGTTGQCIARQVVDALDATMLQGSALAQADEVAALRPV